MAAADLPAADRARFLDHACHGDTYVRQEVESLLRADARRGESVLSAIASEAQLVFGADGIIGSRIGAYRITGEIGRGGMGTVYLAVRDDDQYQKRVAIKLIRRGMDTEDVLDRFRHERQILANLEHPYIARLLDGGSAPDGRPFLVMEYVQGEPLDDYCRHHDLDLRARCRLFLKVCEAVSYAHRSLVVHRDLKPGNILVTADGSPKLLDFGVAKLLDSDGESGRTALAATRPFTPDYASPELLRAERMTTAADVYSLGAVLYELLSGERAHQFASHSLTDLQRTICEIDPRRVSEVAPRWRNQLRGDLDAILGLAMRKEPALRYASVEQLAQDVERYLNGWAVFARQGNVSNRARKFLRRNRTAIAVAALFAGALIGGATTAGLQAARASRAQALAERERLHAVISQQDAQREAREAGLQRGNADVQRRQAELQRIAAEQQRKIAERRFEQVRQLAGKFLLDFHDAIAKLPGSTSARKMVVETGLLYYDTLVREASGNRELLEEIARGYDRLGDVQGNPYFANLGDIPGALVSYRKALALRQQIHDASPEFLRDRLRGNVKIAQLLTVKGDVQLADRTLQEALLLGQQGPASGAYSVREALANAYSAYGDLKIRRGDHSQSVEPYSKVLGLWTQLAHENRDAVSERIGISLAHTKLGDAYTRVERSREALDHLHFAIDIDKQLIARDPNSVPRLRKLYIDYLLLGLLFRARSSQLLVSPEEARAAMEAAADLADRMAAADPNNNTNLIDVMQAQAGLGDWLRKHNDLDTALVHYRKAMSVAEKQSVAGPPNLSNYDALIQVHHRLATGLVDAGQLEEALGYLGKADEYLARADRQNPGLARLAMRHAEINDSRGDAYVRQKKWNDAITAYEAAIAIIAGQRQRDPKSDTLLNAQPELYFRLADCRAAVQQWDAAISTMQTALDRWQEIAGRRGLLADEEQRRKDAAAKLSEWQQR